MEDLDDLLAPPEPAGDKLEQLRRLVTEARDMEIKKKELEDHLKATNIALESIYYKFLPDLFNDNNTASLTLAAEGNYPAVTATLHPFYRARINSDDPPAEREASFEYLESIDAGDLIKTDVIVTFNREQREEAKAFAKSIAKRKPTLNESVHWATLTSWLKEQVEKQDFVPDLTKIGGTIGQVVKLKFPSDH